MSERRDKAACATDTPEPGTGDRLDGPWNSGTGVVLVMAGYLPGRSPVAPAVQIGSIGGVRKSEGARAGGVVIGPYGRPGSGPSAIGFKIGAGILDLAGDGRRQGAPGWCIRVQIFPSIDRPGWRGLGMEGRIGIRVEKGSSVVGRLILQAHAGQIPTVGIEIHAGILDRAIVILPVGPIGCVGVQVWAGIDHWQVRGGGDRHLTRPFQPTTATATKGMVSRTR